MGLDDLIPEDNSSTSSSSSSNSGSNDTDTGDTKELQSTITKKPPEQREEEVEPYEILEDEKPCPRCGNKGVIDEDTWRCENEDCDVEHFVSDEMVFYDTPDTFLGNIDWGKVRTEFKKPSDWSEYMD